VAESNLPSRTQHAREFRGGSRFIGKRTERAFANDRIETCIGSVDPLRVALLERGEICDSSSLGALHGFAHVRRTEINPHHFASEALGEEDGTLAFSRGYIQDSNSR